MIPEPDPYQLKHEADRLSRLDEKFHVSDIDPIHRDEIVKPQPPELYRAPSFLPKTTTPEQVAELDTMLHELWAVNQQHVGENVLEVDVYYSVTGLARPLQERVRAWCQAYFERRSESSRLSPQDHNDPFEMFQRLLRENDRILGTLSTRKGSLNHLFLNLSQLYVPWLLFQRLWKDLVERMADGVVGLYYRPAKRDSPARMADYFIQGRWLTDDLGAFLEQVAEHSEPHHLSAIGRKTDDQLRAELVRMADDIQEMRCFLVKDFNPRKAVVVLSDRLALAWDWCIRFGIAHCFAGMPGAEILAALETRLVPRYASVNRDGLLFDYHKPWITAATSPGCKGQRPLVLNYFVMELFHQKLFSFFDRIDFERIRYQARSRGLEGESEAEVLALSCHDLVGNDPPAPDAPEVDLPGRRRPVKQVRSQRLLTLLANEFACEVGPGKGSEITVYRRGGRKYTLGHHKRNAEVASVVVGRLLKRLGITLGEWLAVVYR